MPQIQNWKMAVRNIEGWVQEIGEAMDRKRAEVPQKRQRRIMIY